MTASSSPPIGCESGRRLLENGEHTNNVNNSSEDIPSLITETPFDLGFAVYGTDRMNSEGEQDYMHCSTAISHSCHFNREDSMEFRDDGAASLDSEAGSDDKGDTVEDIMNFPYTTAVPTSVQDFSLLYPSDESRSDDVERMRSYRERIQQKLRKQVLEQEKESKSTSLFESAGLYAPRNSYWNGDDVSGADGTDFLHGLDGANMGEVETAEELLGNLHGELAPLWDEIEPLASSGHTERRASRSFLTRSLSLTELTSDLCATSQAPNCLPFSITPCRNPILFSQLSEYETRFPTKRRRKTSSPGEIAELARAAVIEEAEAKEAAELEELEKYRDMDLAPLEPIMGSEVAGDLILHGTPVKVQDAEIFRSKHRMPELNDVHIPSRQKPKRGGQLQSQTLLSYSKRLTEEEGEHNVHIKTSDVILQTSDEHQAVSHANHPPFITVIEALPATIFWCAAATITRYTMNAFDALVERLTGLSVKDMPSSTK